MSSLPDLGRESTSTQFTGFSSFVKAYFKTSVCLSLDKNKSVFFNGVINGNISLDIKGDGGFGYDPIFIPEGHQKTYAEMSIQEKNSISHRYVAIKKLKRYLLKLVN